MNAQPGQLPEDANQPEAAEAEANNANTRQRQGARLGELVTGYREAQQSDLCKEILTDSQKINDIAYVIDRHLRLMKTRKCALRENELSIWDKGLDVLAKDVDFKKPLPAPLIDFWLTHFWAFGKVESNDGPNGTLEQELRIHRSFKGKQLNCGSQTGVEGQFGERRQLGEGGQVRDDNQMPVDPQLVYGHLEGEGDPQELRGQEEPPSSRTKSEHPRASASATERRGRKSPVTAKERRSVAMRNTNSGLTTSSAVKRRHAEPARTQHRSNTTRQNASQKSTSATKSEHDTSTSHRGQSMFGRDRFNVPYEAGPVPANADFSNGYPSPRFEPHFPMNSATTNNAVNDQGYAGFGTFARNHGNNGMFGLTGDNTATNGNHDFGLTWTHNDENGLEIGRYCEGGFSHPSADNEPEYPEPEYPEPEYPDPEYPVPFADGLARIERPSGFGAAQTRSYTSHFGGETGRPAATGYGAMLPFSNDPSAADGMDANRDRSQHHFGFGRHELAFDGGAVASEAGPGNHARTVFSL